MTRKFQDLPAGGRFVQPGGKRPCMKLSYPDGGNPDCNAVDLVDGSRLNVREDEDVEVRE